LTFYEFWKKRKIHVTRTGRLSLDLSAVRELTPDGSPDETATSNGTSEQPSNSSTIIDVEAQLLRDDRAFTRPTRWGHGLKSFTAGDIIGFKLFPGADGIGEPVAVSMAHLGYIRPHWINLRATFSVDGIPWPHNRPGQLYVDPDAMWPYGDWSCVIHFPLLTSLEGSPYHGHFTLLLRAVPVEGISHAGGINAGQP
jgi:hypothetical protein